MTRDNGHFPTLRRVPLWAWLVAVPVIAALCAATIYAPTLLRQEADAPRLTLAERAAAGDADAQYRFAHMHVTGLFEQNPDYTTARTWYEKAAAQEHSAAQNDLGIMYETGQGVSVDLTRAATWYERAANNGNNHAAENLGALYTRVFDGDIEKIATAVMMLTRAADAGSVRAYNNLAWIYLKGLGVPENRDKAATWYEKAAATGDENAIVNLCLLYNGDSDYTRALPWCERASRHDPDAAGITASYYLTGRGTARDFRAAGHYLKIGMDGGNDYSAKILLPSAANCLFAKPDASGAFPDAMVQSCLIAAGAENTTALYNASLIYARGHAALGIAPDTTVAAQLRRRALDLGYDYKTAR